MEGRINTDIQALKIIYNRNRHFLIPFAVIIICIGLVMQIIIPQFKTLLEVREEARIASLRLDKLKKDLNMLESLDERVLASQLEISTSLLPINKDFGGILNALFFAAETSGVNIGKFSFQVGDLDKEEQKEEKFSAINISVALDNEITAVNSFIDIIAKTVPISDISVIKTEERISTISLMFYYKVLPSISGEKDPQIIPISQEKMSLLDRIKGFTNASLTDQSLESATPSVKTTNPFAP